MQGKTMMGRGPPECSGLMGSGEVSACLPAVLVEKLHSLGDALLPVMACSMCLGFPDGNKESHTCFFLLILEFISVKGVGFLFSCGLADTSQISVLCTGVCSAVLFRLHGSIMHSQNNSTQLTASFPC